MAINIAEKIQDDIFRKMSAEKKVKLASEFFNFAKALQVKNYGTRTTSQKTRL
ncbi:MAG: hypothetical protein ABH822_02660 [Patescibacteria group bacterium]